MNRYRNVPRCNDKFHKKEEYNGNTLRSLKNLSASYVTTQEKPIIIY